MIKTKILTLIIALSIGAAGYYMGSNQLLSKLSNDEAHCDVLFQLVQEPDLLMTKEYFREHTETICSRQNALDAIFAYQLNDLYHSSRGDLIDDIVENVSASTHDGSILIHFRVGASSKEKSEQIAYALMQTYITRVDKAEANRRMKNLKELLNKLAIQERETEIMRIKLYALSRRLKLYSTAEKSPTNATPATAEEKTEFNIARDEYEKEMRILEAIKDAILEYENTDSPENKPLIYHQQGWSDETARFMEARKVDP